VGQFPVSVYQALGRVSELADRTPRLNEDALGRGSPSECNLNRRIDLDRVAVEDNRFVAPLADCVQC